MRQLRQVAAVFALLLVVSSLASAQRAGTTRQAGSPAARQQAAGSARIWELGADAGLSFGLDDPNVTQLQIPLQSIRAGIHVSPALSIEPFFGYNYLKVDGIDAISQYQFGVGALYHFSQDRTRSQLYLRPSLAIVGVSAGGTSDSEAGIGVGIGMKWPKMGGRMALRGEAGIFAINDNTSINALFGVSFFTR